MCDASQFIHEKSRCGFLQQSLGDVLGSVKLHLYNRGVLTCQVLALEAPFEPLNIGCPCMYIQEYFQESPAPCSFCCFCLVFGCLLVFVLAPCH